MQQANNKTLFGIMLAIYLISLSIQSLLFLNWDVASLIHATEVLLNGGNYATEIFTPNPPMILYLYIPPVIFSKLTAINLITIFRLYIYTLCSVSLALTSKLLECCFEKDNHNLSTFFITLMAIGFLILPTYEFGNRDHLLSVLSMPYLLLTAWRLQGAKPATSLALTTGILAGLAFAIKPHFVIVPAFIELFFIFRKKALLAWLKIETLAIAAILCIYLTLLLTLHTEYVTKIIPFLLRVYYPTINVSLSQFLFYPLTVFCLMSIGMYVALPSRIRKNTLYPTLFIALIGFLSTLALQRTLFYYHFLPALTVALILTCSSLFLLVANLAQEKYNQTKLFLLAAGCISINLYLYPSAWIYQTIYPEAFFTFFALMFSVLLLLVIRKPTYIQILLRTSFIILSGIMLSQFIMDTDLFSHQFIFTILFMVSAFTILAHKNYKQLLRNTAIASLAIGIFYMPSMEEYSLYLGPRQYKVGPLTNMIQFMEKMPEHQSIYAFSPTIYFTYPLIYYTNATAAQRFDQLWPLMGFDTNAMTKEDKKFVIEMVAADIRKNKPDLIFVDPRKLSNSRISHIRMFLNNPAFANEWKNYKLLSTVPLGKMHEIDVKMPVYQRIKSERS